MSSRSPANASVDLRPQSISTGITPFRSSFISRVVSHHHPQSCDQSLVPHMKEEKQNHHKRLTLVERAVAFPSSVPPTRTIKSRGPAVAMRYIQLEDGSCFGSWSDGVSMLLHPPACRTLTQLLPDGTVTRQISAMVGSAAQDKLAHLLAFRNQVNEQPVLDEKRWRGDTFTHASAFPFARWGLQPASALQTSNIQNESMAHAASLLVDAAPTVVCPAQRLSDGSICVEALEGGISLTLLPTLQWVRLSYPLPLKRLVDGVTNDGVMKYEYTYAAFSQMFPIEAIPKRWKFPLKCALQEAHRYKQQLNGTLQQSQFNSPPHTPISHTSSIASSFIQQPQPSHIQANHFDLVMDLPRVKSLQPAQMDQSNKVPLRTAFIDTTAAGPSPAPIESGISDLSWPDNPGHSLQLLHSLPDALPKNSLITASWTPQALYWTFPQQNKVMALIHADASTLVLESNGLFYHYLEPIPSGDCESEQENGTSTPQKHRDSSLHHSISSSLSLSSTAYEVRQKIYSAAAVPALHNASGLNAHEQTYELAPIAATLLRLQQHAAGVLENRAIEAAENIRKQQRLMELQPGFEMTEEELAALSIQPQQPDVAATVKFSAELHERSHVRGVGEFSAFKDGRIKARFTDRCLLDLNASRTEANILLPNGFPLHVTIPSEDANKYQMYLKPTLDFSTWAYQTPQQRLEVQRREQIHRDMVQIEIDRTKRFLALQRMARGEETTLNDVTNSVPRQESTETSQLKVHYNPTPAVATNATINWNTDGTLTPLVAVVSSQPAPVIPSYQVVETAILPSVDESHSISPPRPLMPHDTSLGLPSFLSPIATNSTAIDRVDSTPSFLISRNVTMNTSSTDIRTPITVTTQTPLNRNWQAASPAVTDLTYWLDDLQKRNRELKQKLGIQTPSMTPGNINRY